MIVKSFDEDKRSLKTTTITSDFVIVGGGMAGVCAAIAAARSGVKVVLVQDRPVLGGNASSEVRLWILGATSHMGNNNRWSREGGIIDEILVENLYRNKEGNPVIFDTIILDKVKSEANITLLLNTAVYDIDKSAADEISGIKAFCSQNYTFYDIKAPIFCDSSGDGVVAYRAGCGFRMGAEDKIDYNELFAPDHGEYGELLGHSIYFYSKDLGQPVSYTAPSYALKDIEKNIPRYGNINSGEHGCKFWWLEYGGRLDTIHDTEEIKWELWSVVYGVWDYIKNSGKFPDAENLTLEWVGVIPGKRESRRFEGHKTLIQQDIIEQRIHEDAIAYGGWAIDLHPADGVYSDIGGCIQYHSKGVYGIPYGCFVSKDIKNLYYSGRGISATHVAHGSSRVMATSAFGGQAVGAAAAQCVRKKILPADILQKNEIKELQQSLSLMGQSIPHIVIDNKDNLAAKARVKASSVLNLSELEANGPWYPLNFSAAQMLPVKAHQLYKFKLEVQATERTVLNVELRHSEKATNYTPEEIADTVSLEINVGIQTVEFQFKHPVPDDQYAFLTFLRNPAVEIRMSEARYTGILSVFNKFNRSVNNHGKQTPPDGLGIDSFEFWCPQRRPAGQNFAMQISPSITAFSVDNILNGYVRPTNSTNSWVADPKDKQPTLTFAWDESQSFKEMLLYFDTDYDHAMESVQMGHYERIIPFCVSDYTIKNDKGIIIYEKKNNYQTINRVVFEKEIITKSMTIELVSADQDIPVSLFQIYIK